MEAIMIWMDERLVAREALTQHINKLQRQIKNKLIKKTINYKLYITRYSAEIEAAERLLTKLK